MPGPPPRPAALSRSLQRSSRALRPAPRPASALRAQAREVGALRELYAPMRPESHPANAHAEQSRVSERVESGVTRLLSQCGIRGGP
eukprot:SAG11_NODE_28461_length_321_cov_0.932432_1_plen_86_part_10